MFALISYRPIRYIFKCFTISGHYIFKKGNIAENLMNVEFKKNYFSGDNPLAKTKACNKSL